MASILNADTSNGLKITSDTSGELKIQSAGADIATVDSSGITMAAGKTIPAAALTGTLPALDGSALTNLPGGGKVLQVVQTVKTDTYTASGYTTWTDITGMSASITPSSTSSKILVMTNLQYSISGYGGIRLMRDATAIGLGDAASTRLQSTMGTKYLRTVNDIASNTSLYLDSPSTTSSTTYKLQANLQYDLAYTLYINRGANDDDATYTSRPISTMTLIEIGA